MSKAIVAAFLIFAGGLLLMFSIAGPWYSSKLDSEDSGTKFTIRTEYRFFEIKTTNQSGNSPVKAVQPSYEAAGRSTTGYLMLAIFGLAALACALGAIGGALAIKGSFGAGGDVGRVSQLALVSAVIAIVVPIVFAIAFPLTIGADSAGCPTMGPCQGLMGSGAEGVTRVTWGPTAQYFVPIVSGALLFIGRRMLPDEFQDLRKQPLRRAMPGPPGARGPAGQQWQAAPQQQWPADMWGAPPDQPNQGQENWQGPRRQ